MQLWASILELKDKQWKLVSVASYSDAFEAQLAACKPLDLPELTVPLQPPSIGSDLPLPEVCITTTTNYPLPGSYRLETECLMCSAAALCFSNQKIS